MNTWCMSAKHGRVISRLSITSQFNDCIGLSVYHFIFCAWSSSGCTGGAGTRTRKLPSLGGSRAAMSGRTKVAVTTDWAVRISSRDGIRLNAAVLIPGPPSQNSTGSCFLWMLPSGGSRGPCSRRSWVLAIAWRVTTSKTRAWNVLLRVLALQ